MALCKDWYLVPASSLAFLQCERMLNHKLKESSALNLQSGVRYHSPVSFSVRPEVLLPFVLQRLAPCKS